MQDQCVVTTAKQTVSEQTLVLVLSTRTDGCGGLSGGVVAAIVVVSLLIVLVIIGALAFFRHKERTKSAEVQRPFLTLLQLL